MIKKTKTGLKCEVCGNTEEFTKAIPTTKSGKPSKKIVNMKCVGCGEVTERKKLFPKKKKKQKDVNMWL
ncbi:MAG: hypothetical protein GWP15_03135 [Nitrospirae bacterium]|nr:hypothetical protein [Nitrospirota bacterium]